MIEVADDGRGFDGRSFDGSGFDGSGFDGTDAAGAAGEGHFGLRLMTDAAIHGGGQLDLLSSPGAGTRIRYQAGAE